MTLAGYPPTSSLLSDADGRFWYWQGASGRRYIHTVYSARVCPPLPGAVFVTVKRTCALRTVLSLGIIGVAGSLPVLRGCDEVHVHLLAGSLAQAEAILADLRDGLAVIEASPPDFARAA